MQNDTNNHYYRRNNNMLKQKLTVTLTQERYKILEKYARIEERSLSNMLELMIKAYDEIHKTKY